MKTAGDSMLDNWDDITEEVTAVELLALLTVWPPLKVPLLVL